MFDIAKALKDGSLRDLGAHELYAIIEQCAAEIARLRVPNATDPLTMLPNLRVKDIEIADLKAEIAVLKEFAHDEHDRHPTSTTVRGGGQPED